MFEERCVLRSSRERLPASRITKRQVWLKHKPRFPRKIHRNRYPFCFRLGSFCWLKLGVRKWHFPNPYAISFGAKQQTLAKSTPLLGVIGSVIPSRQTIGVMLSMTNFAFSCSCSCSIRFTPTSTSTITLSTSAIESKTWWRSPRSVTYSLILNSRFSAMSNVACCSPVLSSRSD